MTSLLTTDLDLPGEAETDRSPDPVFPSRSSEDRQVVRYRIRLDRNDLTTRPVGARPIPGNDEPEVAGQAYRSSLCLTERLLRNSPASLRTTVLLLIAVALLGGVMIATLGMVGLALIVGLSALSWYQCALSNRRNRT